MKTICFTDLENDSYCRAMGFFEDEWDMDEDKYFGEDWSYDTENWETAKVPARFGGE